MVDKKNIKKEETPIIVRIRKLRVNYELRYDYLKILTEYIKRFPKEHRSVRKDSIIGVDGKPKDDWVRTISEAKIGEIIAFLIDNKIKFVFENVTNDVIEKLRSEFLNRQKRIAEIIKLKAEMLDVSEEDYSFMKIKPYNYQKQAVKFFEINNGISILGDQPGVGKTCPAFAYATKYKLKTLIICPASLKLMWRKEILKFTNEKAFVFKLNPPKKSKIIPYSKEESLFHITNFESIETYIKIEYHHKCKGKNLVTKKNCDWEDVDLNKKVKKCPKCLNIGSIKSRASDLVYFNDGFFQEINPEDYDLIIIDECHRMKDLSTDWTKIIHKALKSIPKKILLSGTVIKSRPDEFFSALNFIMPQEWKNHHEFGVRYCAGYESNYGWDYKGASNLEELFERVSPYFLRRKKHDVLSELPPKTYLEIPIELDTKEITEYRRLEKELVKEIVNGKEVEKEESYLSKIHKLKKFTGKIKIKKAIDIIEDIIESGEKVVIVSDYVEIAEIVAKHFSEISVLHTGSISDVEKQAAVDKFQEDKNIKVFSGMIIASGVGNTLTAASKLIKVGFSWTPADEEQVEDRIHRASSTADTIEIITLYCVDTIDEDIMELLDDKSYIVSRTLDSKEFKKTSTKIDESIYKDLIKRMKEKT